MLYDVSYSDLRKNLKAYLDFVCQDHRPIFIHRKNGAKAVLISEEDYRSLEETASLTRSPRHLKRLLEALGREGGYSFEDIKKNLDL